MVASALSADPDRPEVTRHEALSSRTAASAPLALVSAAQATFQVTTLADVVDANDGVLSLREAIGAANDRAGDDTITFADAIQGGTIELLAPLTVTDRLAIEGDPGSGFDGIRLRGIAGGPSFSDALISVSDSDLTLQHLTIDGWYGSYSAISGTRASIDFANSLLTGRAGGNGGPGSGVEVSDGRINFIDSTISNISGFNISGIVGEFVRFDRSIFENFREEFGLAISADTLKINQSTIQNNMILDGGGIIVTNNIDISKSTFANNIMSGVDNTIIDVKENITVGNSTFADNQTSADGPTAAVIELRPDATGQIIYSTMTGTGEEQGLDPTTATGTGIFLGVGSRLSLVNTIIDDTIDGELALLESEGFDFVRNYSDGLFFVTDYTASIGMGPKLLFDEVKEIGESGVFAGVAADNGGPTATVALLDSPFNSALDNAAGKLRLLTDQRGFARDATPDVGAFELDADKPIPPDTLPPLAEGVAVPDAVINGVPRSALTLTEARDAAISFVDETAAFQSSLGVYLIGPAGEIVEPRWVFERIEHALPDDSASAAVRPGGGPSTPGDTLRLSDLYAPWELQEGNEFGLFLVADGAARNPFIVFDGGTLDFRSGGNSADVTDTTPQLVHIAETGIERVIQGDIIHTVDAGSPNPLSNTLNPGNQGQALSGLFDGLFTVAFEDKPFDSSDKDFNDVLVAVELFHDAPAQMTAPASGAETVGAAASLATLIVEAASV